MSTWSVYKESKDLGLADSHIETGLTLEHGSLYRSNITLCFHSVCYKSLTSDGFLVATEPPVGRSISASSHADSGTLNIDVNFEEFEDVTNVLDHYEWTLVDSSEDEVLLLPWQVVTDITYGTESDMVCIYTVRFGIDLRVTCMYS